MTYKDKLKSVLREMFVARPEDNDDLIWKAPAGGLFGPAVVTVRADETAVVARGGQPAGVLAPGHHLLAPDLAALLHFVDDANRATLTAMLTGEAQPIDVSISARVCGLLDAPTGASLDCRCVAEATLEVRDAPRLVRAFVGSGAVKTEASLGAWVEKALLSAVRAELQSRVRASRVALLDVIADAEAVKAALVEASPSLDAVGLRVRAFGRLELSLDDDSSARLEVARRTLPRH